MCTYIVETKNGSHFVLVAGKKVVEDEFSRSHSKKCNKKGFCIRNVCEMLYCMCVLIRLHAWVLFNNRRRRWKCDLNFSIKHKEQRWIDYRVFNTWGLFKNFINGSICAEINPKEQVASRGGCFSIWDRLLCSYLINVRMCTQGRRYLKTGKIRAN